MPSSSPTTVQDPAAVIAQLTAQLKAERTARFRAEREAATLRQKLATAGNVDSPVRTQRRADARTALLIREVPLGLVLTDPFGRVLLANEQFSRLLGLETAADQLLGLRVKQIVRQALPAFARPAEVRAWARVIPRQTVPVRNLQLPLADGRVIELDVQPLAEAEGGGWLLVGRDVTAREQARREVAEQRAFYETILNHLPSDVAVLDVDHRYRFVNPAAIADPAVRHWIVGHTDAEYCAYRGRPLELATRRFDLFEQAIRERRLVMWEENMAATDGTPRVLRRHLQPVFHAITGQFRMMIGYGLEVTAIRKAEQTIAAQRTFYETILDNLPADVAVFDHELRYRYLNPQAQPNTELREWVIGKNWNEYVEHVNVPPARAAQRHFVLDQVLTTRQMVAWDEVLPLNGLPRILRRHLKPLHHADGSLYLLIGYGVDITAVREAQREAEEAVRARENFLASMSHEIRTPLNGVLGMAALLAKTPLTPTQHEFLATVQNSGRHLLALLNDVLDMAKISSGHLELEATPIDLADLLRTAAQHVAFRAAEKGIELRVEAPVPAAPAVLADPHRLQQVLLNLLSNALKFTEHGTVRLVADVRQQTAEALTVCFRVHDTGLGIAADRQEAVFEEFTQAYSDTTRRFGGTGLGLAISRQLVERMGGQLLLSSVPDEGTAFAFTLRLPRAASAVASLAPPEPVPMISLRGRRILLAEDHDVNRLLARLLLEAHGLEVVEAVDGAAAVALIEQTPLAALPELVLMDIQMPTLNGLEATAAIRVLPNATRAGIPIVALTANAFRSDVERYLAAGMNACLTKPFEEADLLRILHQLLPPRPAGSIEAPAADTAAENASEPEVMTEGVFPATLLRMGRQDLSFAYRIVDAFLANGPAALHVFTTATPADGATVADTAHKLAPSVRMLDAPALADTLIDLERLSPTDGFWADAVAFASQELADLIDQLRTWRACG
jgi:signal transduction histidine kinase/DNA-binding NarL/FixJ family response regulator